MHFDVVLLAVIIAILLILAMFLIFYFQRVGALGEKVSRLDFLTQNKLEIISTNLDSKLEKVRHIVDEKMQESIQKNFHNSFNLISERLENVNKSLGEMQTIASGVIDLKRILANVKTRGTWGEVQLESILENLLTPTQYEKNAKVKPNSRELVEFAINIPNDSNENGIALLPIDSKFPIESYERLVKASEDNDAELVEKYSKEIEHSIRKNAKDISEKYIAPPFTTDFAIMFLPTEGLYSEVIRKPALLSEIQQKNRVIITGPMTISALINSLQMSFRSHALQKNAKEVWKLFAQIKDDFSKHNALLETARRKLYEAGNAIDNIEERSRILSNKLSKIESITD